MNNMSLQNLYDYLLEGINSMNKKVIVLLFDNSNQKNKVANTVVEAIRKNPNFHINLKKPLLFQTNIIQVNNYKVYLGLKKDEKFLVNIYGKSSIFYYVQE